jgi:cytochrome c peroxidase
VAWGQSPVGWRDARGSGKIFPPLANKNSARSPQLDALAEYIARGSKTLNSPTAGIDPGSATGQLNAKGRKLFADNNCASCRGGGGWASSWLDFAPLTLAEINATEGIGQLTRFLKDVGTFNAAAANEVRQNSTDVKVVALGKFGCNPPSLLGAFALAPYLHNGSALSLEEVMELVSHRTSGIDKLSNIDDRKAVVEFLKSIDATTEPFSIP